MVISTQKVKKAVVKATVTGFTLPSVHHRTGKKNSKLMIHLSVEKMVASTMTVVRCHGRHHVRMATSTLKANTVAVEVLLKGKPLASVLQIQKGHTSTNIELLEEETVGAI
jgi:hypothetical protein